MATRFAGLLAAAVVPAALALTQTWQGARALEREGFENGLVKVRSAYGVGETVDRIRKDVADRGIMLFNVIDQAKLADDAGIALRPSTLLVFGNPRLGSQFMTSNPLAGIDWPVRLLVVEDERGEVWAVYNDFAHIARRHEIADRNEAFSKASEVIGSITSSVAP